MIEHIVIMAGGAGKRLWPASVKEKPKQFLLVRGGKTLFGGTLDRALYLGSSGYIIVVTHEDHRKEAAIECAAYPEDVRKRIIILAEPIARNTAPAIFLAAAWLKTKGESNSSMLVLAADHIISTDDQFKISVEKASNASALNNFTVFGIRPDSAETGYGYIEADTKGSEKSSSEASPVISFKEKPDAATAKQFLEAGNYFWNSGMFVFPVELFLSEMKKFNPEMASLFLNADKNYFPMENKEGVSLLSITDSLRNLYGSSPSLPIDIALMEQTQNRLMVEADFVWNDVGSWDAMAEEAEESEPCYTAEAKGNFVYSDIPVALCGVEDLIIVIRNGKALVCKKGESQLVKVVVEDHQLMNK